MNIITNLKLLYTTEDSNREVLIRWKVNLFAKIFVYLFPHVELLMLYYETVLSSDLRCHSYLNMQSKCH